MISTTAELYHRIAPFYDAIYGVLLQPGRQLAMMRLTPRPGERVLEIGVGTGFALRAYPDRCSVVGIDLSASMIARANARRRRHRLERVVLCRMDGAALALADDSFDAVYAPYVINVVPNPIQVAREIIRVCRPGGRVVLLNHFDRHDDANTPVTRLVGRVASTLTGVNWSLPLAEFMRDSGLHVESIEPANFGGVSSVVVCRTR